MINHVVSMPAPLWTLLVVALFGAAAASSFGNSTSAALSGPVGVRGGPTGPGSFGTVDHEAPIGRDPSSVRPCHGAATSSFGNSAFCGHAERRSSFIRRAVGPSGEGEFVRHKRGSWPIDTS